LPEGRVLGTGAGIVKRPRFSGFSGTVPPGTTPLC